MKPVIHYLWVGQPTKTDPTTIAGHDIAGPINMARALKIQEENGEETNPIKFWCLETHANFYRTTFESEGVDIEICTIEGLLEKESDGDLADRAKSVQGFMAEYLGTVETRVAFKDIFSLFLLASEGGYFFDTNVFPEKNKPISLLGEPVVTTAKSGFQEANDFYMMYSPGRQNADMINIVDDWIREPGFGSVSVFKVAEVPYFNSEMGVQKLSYKSYHMKNDLGLFYWLNREIELFEEHLKYGDIDEQRTFSPSAIALQEASLCYLKDPTEETLLALPFTTNEAFVSDTKSNKGKIYYVNKEKGIAALVLDKCSTLFDIFSVSDKIYGASSKDILTIANEISPSHFHPEYIVNTENCTLLHHAVLSKNTAQVQALLKSGARLDLVATYEIRPSGQILEVTPIQLAQYLQYEEITSLLLQAKDKKQEAPPEMEKEETSSGQAVSREKEDNSVVKQGLFRFFQYPISIINAIKPSITNAHSL